VLEPYRDATSMAQKFGVGVNAGHDLDLQNLPTFLSVGGVLEVSIGHALVVECIEQGIAPVVSQYLAICRK
jgi:pyridoxine 5-phosphate synthase